MDFFGKKILFCVTGGIAAYKAPEILRAFMKRGFEVEIILTEAAEQLVSPLALSTLAGKKAWRQRDFLSADEGYKIPHISLSKWADAVVVAPCTANTLCCIARGRASSLVSAAVLATREKPVIVFPAMNDAMLDNPATVENIKILGERGFFVVSPAVGALACGDEARGRLPETETIIEETVRALVLSGGENLLVGKKILITAGGTVEKIDPVRFISNASSGKMGAALAKTARRRGAEVRVVSASSLSADELLAATLDNLDWADVIVKAAAVGDYKVAQVRDAKIKREGGGAFSLELVQNPDIAAEVGRRKRSSQILIGFALETNDLLENARAKMERKNLDIIVANDARALGADSLDAVLIHRDGRTVELRGSKDDVADGIWDNLDI